jgi:hypothetical protein
MLYMGANRRFAVEYVSLNGSYDVVEVVPQLPSRDWPVHGNRDWMNQAITLCDELDANATQ